MPSPPNQLTLRLLLVFTALDLLFKLFTFPTYLVSIGLEDAGHGRGITLRFAAIVVPTLVAVAVVFVRWMRPVERWLDAERRGVGDPQLTGRAAARLQQLPLWISGLWGAQWLVVYVALSLVLDTWRSPPIWLLVAAVTVGSPPLGFLVTGSLLGPAAERASLAARAAGVRVDAPPLSLRRQMSLFALCLTLAPPTYIASLAFTTRLTSMPMNELVILVGWFFVAILVYATLSARFVSDAIVAPLDRMSEVIRTIAQQGEVSLVGRVPHLRRDELGTLAEWTNRMIDRLEETERERAQVSLSLEALNRTLEQRVEERTVRLAQERLSTIVRSMKEFAHPDRKEMAAVDLNHAIESTLTIARSEYN